MAIAVLVIAGPAFTWAGAEILRDAVAGDVARVSARAAPVEAAYRRAAAARQMLATAFAAPTAGEVLDRLAARLPGEGRLLAVTRSPEGRLKIEVATPDPDRLRAALRGDPMLAGLRETGQLQGDGVMEVVLESRP